MASRRGLLLALRASLERNGESLLGISSHPLLRGARLGAESSSISSINLRRLISSSSSSSSTPFPFSSSSPTARTYSERKLFAYPTHQVFDVVADVQHYDMFVPWCVRSTVLRVAGGGGGGGQGEGEASGGGSGSAGDDDDSESERTLSSSSNPSPSTSSPVAGALRMEAELEVGFRSFSERYTSNVTLKPFTNVETTASGSALFRHLDCRWRFEAGPLPEKTTWVDFAVSFEFRSAVHRHLASVFFDEVVTRMVRAFEGRCAELYGAPSVGRRRKVVVGTPPTTAAAATRAAAREGDGGKIPA